jgi:calcium-dependent protein kinase
MAPELAAGKPYTNKVDVWAVGVIATQLVTGNLPFNDRTEDGLYNKIINKEPNIYKNKMPETCYDFVKKCLQKDPHKRPTVAQLLQSEWIRSCDEDKGAGMAIEIESLKDLTAVRNLNRFQLAVRSFMHTYFMNSEKLELWEKIFKELDSDKNGTLDKKELLDGFEKISGIVKSREELEELFSIIDTDNSGSIDWGEFQTATMANTAVKEE